VKLEDIIVAVNVVACKFCVLVNDQSCMYVQLLLLLIVFIACRNDVDVGMSSVTCRLH